MPTTPIIAPVPQLPQYRWNAAAGQYIGENGKFISRVRVRGALDTFISASTNSMEVISKSLVNGELSLAQWQSQMMVLSKDVNLAGAALERGGWYQMDPSAFGRAGSKIKGEYGFLNDFAEQIASGKQPLNGTLPRRARLYGEQGRVTYYDFSRVSAIEDGFTEERSVLTPGDTCEECAGEAAKDFVPIGTLQPIGKRECLSNCNCFMEYRKPSGDTRIR